MCTFGVEGRASDLGGVLRGSGGHGEALIFYCVARWGYGFTHGRYFVEQEVFVGDVPAMAGGLLVVGILYFFNNIMTVGCKVSLGSLLKLRFFVTSSFGPTRLVACVFVRNNFRRVFFGVFTL